MPNIGMTEMIFISVVLLLVFGAKRLPELGAGMGKGIREFKRSINDIKHEVSREDEEAQQIRTPPARAQVAPPQPAPTVTAEEIRQEDGTTFR